MQADNNQHREAGSRFHRQKYIQVICSPSYKISTGREKSLSIDQLPINDSLSNADLSEIHPRMHAGNLGHGVLKPHPISINNVISELFLSLVEEFVLAG